MWFISTCIYELLSPWRSKGICNTMDSVSLKFDLYLNACLNCCHPGDPRVNVIQWTVWVWNMIYVNIHVLFHPGDPRVYKKKPRWWREQRLGRMNWVWIAIEKWQVRHRQAQRPRMRRRRGIRLRRTVKMMEKRHWSMKKVFLNMDVWRIGDACTLVRSDISRSSEKTKYHNCGRVKCWSGMSMVLQERKTKSRLSRER